MAGRRLAIPTLLGVLCVGAGSVGAGEPALRFEPAAATAPEDPGSGSLVVTGLPRAAVARLVEAGLGVEKWERLLSLRTNLAWPDGPAVLGRYRTDGSTVRFTPRFPLVAGLGYHGRFDGEVFDALSGQTGHGTVSRTLGFSVPEPKPRPSTRVVAIYPSAFEIPENTLRLYIEFSGPMRAKEVAAHVRLLDSRGREVALPFVEVRHGLWDPRQRRLTLFFHPGRVKRGVGPNLAMGPPIRAGETYRLVVDRGLQDSRGQPLSTGYEKEFRVTAADRKSPEPSRWRLEQPAATRAPLSIEFPESLDRALLSRLLRVKGPAGEPIEGKVVLSENETRWSFFPAAPWRSGEHTLSVHPGLEDLAGNSIGRSFEAPVARKSFEPGIGDSEPSPPVEFTFRMLR